METRSLTITGLIITALSFLFLQIGLPITDNQLNNLVEQILKVAATLGELIGIVVAWLGRHKQGDITLLGRKRSIITQKEAEK